ncbi:hypothetical protein [Botrimarina sp.]|uniref:galactose-1-phosphate uridylyltransferase n=1 Tax=Botrimarina sp. TaxID=2795802 RepID=UPI0032EE4BB1
MLWRHDPLTDRTVRLAAGRVQRPSDFDDPRGPPTRCPFCAGAEQDTPAERLRIAGGRGGWLTRVVDNLYPIVEADGGAHEVVVESPRHVRRLVDLTDEETHSAAAAWFGRLAALQAEGLDYGLVFKNEGPLAGATLEHVHSQVVALRSTPAQVEAMWRRVAAGGLAGGASVYEADGLRVIAPPAPRVAYEAWIAPAAGGPTVGEVAADPLAAARVGGLVRRVAGVATGLAAAPALNLVLQAPPRAYDSSPWWLEVLPRRGLAAGFEIATGVWVNSVDPETAAAALAEALNSPDRPKGDPAGRRRYNS